MARRGKYDNENFLAQGPSFSYSLRPPPAEIIHNCLELNDYLRKVYSFQLSDEYAETLSKPRTKYRINGFTISKKAIDSIMTVCNMWKEFIDIDYYDLFVNKQIVSLIQIHSCVISARNFQEKQGIPLKKQPSETFVTLVNNLGKITVYP